MADDDVSDRAACAAVAPPQGLYLAAVDYSDSETPKARPAS